MLRLHTQACEARGAPHCALQPFAAQQRAGEHAGKEVARAGVVGVEALKGAYAHLALFAAHVDVRKAAFQRQ